MPGPRLYTTPAEIALIGEQLEQHDWYARCFANLRAPADELLRRGISIPRGKGYVFYETCPTDNTPLRHDPFDPHTHPCPSCGRNYDSEPYHRAWVAYYQMYLSQRALEMGIVYQVTGDDAYAAAIRSVLLDYARHYEEYPLDGYILGPTRLFQSTYIESLWLANLAAAADLARDALADSDWRQIRNELFLASAEIIKSFDEGDNNRQAMHNVAIGFVGLLCDEPALVEHATTGPHGWLHHLQHSVLEDGMWYEGDNYHFATLPAMLNLADAMSRNGHDLFTLEAGGRLLKMMFDAPLADLYPDLTMPARKDSRYNSPLGQRWHAGMYELGLRRYRDPAYAQLLQSLYRDPPAEEACLRNVAGFIDTLPSRPANREQLDWRGFLNAMPTLDSATGHAPAESTILPGTGLGILRADQGRTYASLDYGRYGGQHGHPDRLHLNLYTRGRRWLTDWGTGNYLFDHLQWYRSTVSHNTVVVDGRNQQPADGHLCRFATGDGHGLVAAEVDGAYPDVRLRRCLILLSPDLMLDLFTVVASGRRQLDWTIHPYADPTVKVSGDVGPRTRSQVTGEHYEWLDDVHRAAVAGPWVAVFGQAGDSLAVHGLAHPGSELYTATALGAPDRIPEPFPVLIVRRHAADTTFVTLFEHRRAGRPGVSSFHADGDGRYVAALHNGDVIECSYDDRRAYATITRNETATSLGTPVSPSDT